jgi:anti-anti-sigma factor
VLLTTAKSLNRNGGTLRVCSPQATVKEVLEMSGFMGILNVVDTEEEALAAF